MNNKQKLGYTLLGAGIMAVGITIGQWGTPGIEAQSNGVFDKITCRELEVVDKDGNKAIGLQSNDKSNSVSVYDRQGEQAIDLGIENNWTRLTFWDKFEEKALVLESKGRVLPEVVRGLTIYQAFPLEKEEAIALKYTIVKNSLLINHSDQGSTLIDGQSVKVHQLEVRDYNHYPVVHIVGGRQPLPRGVIVYRFESFDPVIELESSPLGQNSLKIYAPSSENLAIALISHREKNGDRVDKDGSIANHNTVYVADTIGRGAITLRGDFKKNVLSIHDKYDTGSIAFRASSVFDTPDGLNFAVKRDRKTGKISNW